MSTHASTFSEEGRWAKNPHDFYQTPKELVFALLSFVPGNPQRILDVGAGKGVWGEAARSIWPDAQITGIELQDFPQPSAYDCWLANTDFLTWKPDHNFDLVMGNPPYSVRGTQHGAGKIARKGYRLLADGGTQLLLLKTEFLNGQWRYEHLWPEAPLEKVLVAVERPSFYCNGHTNSIEYSGFMWRKTEIRQPYPLIEFVSWR